MDDEEDGEGGVREKEYGILLECKVYLWCGTFAGLHCLPFHLISLA